MTLNKWTSTLEAIDKIQLEMYSKKQQRDLFYKIYTKYVYSTQIEFWNYLEELEQELH